VEQFVTADASARELMDWLDNPPNTLGMYFSTRDDWSFYSYADLAKRARQVAGQLRQAGADPGQAVIVAHGNTPDFVAAFFGSLLAACTPVPAAPCAAFKNATGYAKFMGQIVKLTGTRFILAEPSSARVAEAATNGSACILSDVCADGVPEYQGMPARGDVAYLQLSSGTHGFPRAVRITYSAISANVTALRSWLGSSSEDALATWLPLHHDMGLVGGCLSPIMQPGNVWMMRPEEFIRSPLRWLSCFGEKGATIGIMPNFGLAQIARRVRSGALEAMDFSRWRALVVGAERIDRTTVDAVAGLLEPFGFDARAMAPAYGMAETVLAVTGSGLGDKIRSVWVDAARLAPGEPVQVNAGQDSSSRVELVSCGKPLEGIRLEIVDDGGRALPEGMLGEIQVSGPSVAGGYVSSPDAERSTQQEFGGIFKTGDSGFLLGDELYVVGRIGDCVKFLGRWLYAEDIGDVAARVAPPGHPPLVLLGSLAGSNTAMILVDRSAAEEAAAIGRAVTDSFAGLRAIVAVVRPGEIQRTTSGKPSRLLTWRSLVTGNLPERTVWDSQSLEPDPVTR
jgi:acyl-CoA synthetase (AMP-forming)/AMP-acid ligase II